MSSVAAQTYPNLEYVVVDGASTDGTLDVIKAHEGLVSQWISEPDEGIYDAMNKGIALCTGSLVKLLNADDLLPPASVERVVAQSRTAPPGTCFYGDVNVMSVDGEAFGLMTLEGGVRYFPVFLHPAWYIPRSVYEEHGLYRTDFRVASDYEYSLRLRQAGVRFEHLGGEPLITFRTDGASSSLRGVGEGFRINRDYQGLWPACYVAGTHLYKKLRSRFVRRLLGERLALRARAAVHQVRGTRRGTTT